MAKRRSKYTYAPVGEDDLLQALEAVEEQVQGVNFSVRRVKPDKGDAYLLVVAIGWLRAPKIGTKARQTAEGRWPSNQHTSLVSLLFSLAYTLSDCDERLPDSAWGRYTELAPGFPHKR